MYLTFSIIQMKCHKLALTIFNIMNNNLNMEIYIILKIFIFYKITFKFELLVKVCKRLYVLTSAPLD